MNRWQRPCPICDRSVPRTKKAIAVRKIPATKGPKGSFDCIRRSRPVKVCADCHEAGFYNKLSYAVIMRAIRDFRQGPGSFNIIKLKNGKKRKIYTDKDLVHSFGIAQYRLFDKGGDIEKWSFFTKFTVARIRELALYEGLLNLNIDELTSKRCYND